MAERTGHLRRTVARDQRPGQSQTHPPRAMARLLRASCLFSLLLAGLVPSLGQEKSKVSEPPGGGRGNTHSPQVSISRWRGTPPPGLPSRRATLGERDAFNSGCFPLLRRDPHTQTLRLLSSQFRL